MAEERIQKLLAQAGFGSRRACEAYLVQHRVRVNGKLADLGAKADPDHDTITVDGRRVRIEAQKIYVMLNKPMGVVTTNEDEFGRRIVRDLIPIEGHLYSVGRLDADSEGLVLLTNDGELANALTHPRYEHEKEYQVLVEGRPVESTLKQWRRGVVLEGQPTASAHVEVISAEGQQTWLRVVMHEGRKRQIREVAGMLGHRVKYLRRVRIGSLAMGALKTGRWRHLTSSEVRQLRSLVERSDGRPSRRQSQRAPRDKPPRTRSRPAKTSRRR